MIISKYGLPHAEQYLVALKELRQQYLDWRHELSERYPCTLCKTTDRLGSGSCYVDRICPWYILDGNPCFSGSRLVVLEQNSKTLRKVKLLRKIALKLNKPIAKRIKELDLWIAVYKQYIHYINRDMPPELAAKLTKSIYGDFLNEARN
jgi:hypothetical protein